MDKAFKKLDQIKSIKEKIAFKDDSRIVEIFEMAVAGDRNRLQNAEGRMIAAEQEHGVLKSRAESANNRLKALEDELLRVKNTCDQLENGVILSSNNLKDIEEKKASIAALKSLLRTYQDLTGVHFSFNSPQEVVAGCVAVMGSTPAESKMKTFILDKGSSHLQDEIWKKVHEVVSDNTDLAIYDYDC